jgi:hypothetical protein
MHFACFNETVIADSNCDTSTVSRSDIISNAENSYKQIPPSEDTPISSFHAERLTGFGGSDAGKYMSTGRYHCVRAVCYEKLQVPADYPFEGSDATERGVMLEDAVARRYAEETGRKIKRVKKAIRDKFDPWLLVHIDRLIFSGEQNLDQDGHVLTGPGVLEVKTMRELTFRRFIEDGLPIYYQLQLQHAMAVTGYQWGAFAVFGDDKLRYWDVRRDEELISKMREQAAWAWSCVESGRRLIQIGESYEPSLPERLNPLDPRCKTCDYRDTCQAKALREKFGDGFEPAASDYDESLAPLVREFKRITRELAPKQERLEQLAQQLKQNMQDRLTAKCSAGFVSYRVQSKGKSTFRVLRVN